jgi:hypothetical protein
MRGPFALRPLHVDISVPCRVGGVYCLAKEPRRVCYVGRADHDLRDAIKAHQNQYLYFWYEPALTPRDAYVTECYEFHKRSAEGGLVDTRHPVAPDKLDQKCPVCGQ